MNWVSASCNFPIRRAVIEIPDELGIGDRIRSGLINPTEDVLEKVLYGEIVTARPELGGCVLHYMGYEIAWRRWEVGISHSSLERVCHGCIAPRIELKKETGHPTSQAKPLEGQ